MTADVLDSIAKFHPKTIVDKPKLELLLYPIEAVEGLELLIEMSTEALYSFNAVFREAPVFLNTKSPSRDVCID